MATDQEILRPPRQNINARITDSLRFTGTISPADSNILVEIVIEDTTTENEYVIGNGITNASGEFSITTSCPDYGSYWGHARVGDSYSDYPEFLINID